MSRSIGAREKQISVTSRWFRCTRVAPSSSPRFAADSVYPARPAAEARTRHGVGLTHQEHPPRAPVCSMICATLLFAMARSLHVRLDDASAAALDVVRAAGMTDSEAVRTALRESAARRRVRSAIREEVRRVAADESDREEMRVIREQMAGLAPPSAV